MSLVFALFKLLCTYILSQPNSFYHPAANVVSVILDPMCDDGRLIINGLVVLFVIQYMFSNRSILIRLLPMVFIGELAN